MVGANQLDYFFISILICFETVNTVKDGTIIAIMVRVFEQEFFKTKVTS